MNNSSMAKMLLESGAFELNLDGKFTWASGIESPFYCDNRKLLSFPEKRSAIVAQLTKLILEEAPEVEVIAGVATAGIPHAALVANELNLPLIYVRSKAKDHGRENRIEGILSKGNKVAVIEDLISTAGSSIEAAKAVRDAGGEVIGIFSLFTYGLSKAKENARKADLNCYSLLDIDTLLEEAVELNYITNDGASEIKKFRDGL